MTRLYDLKSATERSKDIPSLLEEAGTSKMTFGIDFLDRALIGILPTDLVVIGAGSGIGKTQLGVEIAKWNVRKGKKVLFMALEAEPCEIEMRIRYQMYASHYFCDEHKMKGVRFDYRNYRFGFLKEALKKYEGYVEESFKNSFDGLYTLYKTKNFTEMELFKAVDEQKDNCDMIIIDHLHYIQHSSINNEFERISRLMERIRSLNLYYKKPVILFSHLRKDFLSAVPSLGDLHGHSDVQKQATLVVLLSKDDTGPSGYRPVTRTIINIAKGRTGSLGCLGFVDYNVQLNAYKGGFQLGYYNKKDECFTELQPENYPYWAK